jgi:hypothetical protein
VLGNTLYQLVIAHPNAAHLLNAIGFCLFSTPATFRNPLGGYDGSQVTPLTLPCSLSR